MVWRVTVHKIVDCAVGVICESICIIILMCVFEGMQALLLVCVCSSVVVNEHTQSF